LRAFEPARRRRRKPWILVDIKAQLVGREHKAEFIRHPRDDLVHHSAQAALLQTAFVAQRGIQIFGKPIGLEIALLEAGSALADPCFCKLRVRVSLTALIEPLLVLQERSNVG